MARGSLSALACTALGVVAAVSLTAGGSAATGATVSVVAGKPSELSLRLTPRSVAAGRVVFKVQNAGKLPHRLQVCTSVKGGACTGRSTPVLAPGKTATLAVTLVAGKLQLLDAVAGRAGTA